MGKDLLHSGSRLKLRSNPYAFLLAVTYELQQRLSIGRSLKRHPFSGLIHSAGELLHIL